VFAVVALCSSARADSLADLQASGEELAKNGRYGEAIAKFKEADKIEKRPTFACLIALAYTRKENWPQAELYLSLCHERGAAAGATLPDWVPLADQQIKERLDAAGVVPVTIRVEPTGVDVKLTVSSFAPDEQFGPRTIYLPLGTHAIVAHSPGHDDVKRVIEIKDWAKPIEVVIDLDAKPLDAAPRIKRGGTLMKAGLIVAGAGLVSYGVFGFAWWKEKSIADADPSNDGDYAKYYDLYTYTRISTIALWTAGAGLMIGSLVLRGSSGEAPTVTLAPTDGGGMIGVGWSR
jgi:hypothetical protein